MGARIKKDIVMQYKIIQSSMSLKFGAQYTAVDGRTTHPHITHTILQVLAGRHFGQLCGSK